MLAPVMISGETLSEMKRAYTDISPERCIETVDILIFAE